jgi:hypothetical protein
MDCVPFWTWVASGVFIVPLLGWLKTLPKVGPVIEQWAFLVAQILAVLAPVVANAATPYCAKIDPLVWTGAYAFVAYAVSQLVFWVNKRLLHIGR